jgi:hypothetical protein
MISRKPSLWPVKEIINDCRWGVTNYFSSEYWFWCLCPSFAMIVQYVVRCSYIPMGSWEETMTGLCYL